MLKKRKKEGGKESLNRQYHLVYGHKISYLTGGQKNNPPLVFLHGVFASAAIYRRFLKILSRKFRVYAIDLPGFGRSSMPRNILTIDDYTDIIFRFITDLKIKKPVMAGHSAGGLVALDMALRHGHILKKIVLINAAGLKLKYSFKDLYIDLILKSHINQISRYHLWREALIILSDFIRGAATPVYWKILKHDSFVNYETKLKKIKIPALIIWGKNDLLFPIHFARKFKELLPNSKLITTNGDHDWLVLHPKQTYPLLNKI
ncbi:MAG: alpha/beta hydrolase [Nanoarchaeota archaeon]|nr:alpha/beta hydrolase [Nanoarchaeota archaeon]